MTTSSCERISAAVAVFISANMATYVARANTGTIGTHAPMPKKCEVSVGIPDNGPYPYIMVNRDSVQVEPTGNDYQRLTVYLSVNVAISESKPQNADVVADRYTDALIDMFGENITLGGTVDLIYLESADKLVVPSSGQAYVLATVKVITETSTA